MKSKVRDNILCFNFINYFQDIAKFDDRSLGCQGPRLRVPPKPDCKDPF